MISTVEIGGTAWDPGEVLADVTIRHGRSSWGEEPNASSASLTLWDAPKDLPATIGVGRSLVLLDQLGDPRFTGTITDASATFPDPQLGARIALTAVGALAGLGRRTVGLEDYPQEVATMRAKRLFSAAGIALTGRVECPPAHDYLVAARPAKAVSALEALTELANTLGAVLFDTPSGEVVIQALHDRPLHLPHEIPAHRCAYAPTWRMAWEVENVVSVKWAGGTVTDRDPASVTAWGEREGKIETSLATDHDARARALDRLIRLANPRWQLPEVVTDLLPTEFPGLEPGDLALVATDQVAGLPLPGYPMVIEGWQDQQRGATWTTTFHLSDGLMSFAGLAWKDIPPADPRFTWAAIDQATIWTNALTLSDLEA